MYIWEDDYILNGYMMNGFVLKVNTLNARIYLFLERNHPIIDQFIDVENKCWNNNIKDQPQILNINYTEKVELYDNNEDGFEGLVCYTATDDSTLWSSEDPNDINMWI
jgi:hypothetical protein